MPQDIIKEGLLDALVTFHKFCEAHQLRYTLICGTLLGAVRHRGFIPWDDDIDVAMSRADYEKLLSLSSSVPHGFQLNSIENNESYIYPFAKFCTNRVIVEEPFYKPFATGLWVDVFPLDYTFENRLIQKLQFSCIKALRKLLILKTRSFKTSKRNVVTRQLAICLATMVQPLSISALYKLMTAVQVDWPKKFSKKKMLANFQGAWGEKEVAPKEIFDDLILYDFEGHQFYGVRDSDYLLTKVYGDYMTPPPANMRKSEHIGKVLEVK